MEQHKSYKDKDNPVGVGKHFGVLTHDDIDPHKKAGRNELDVDWFDGKRIPIKQVLCWLCPPKGTQLRCITKPGDDKIYNIEVQGYSSRGVSLIVQHVGFKGKKTSRKASVTPRKAPQKTKRGRKKTRLRNTRAKIRLTSESEDACPSTTWKRFKRERLSAEVRAKLVEEVVKREQEICDEVFDKFRWIPFANRVTREYTYLHTKRYNKDVMHLHRETVLAAAVPVILDQLKPLVVRPLDGNRDEIVEACQRILEAAFDLPGLQKEEKKSSKGWINYKLQTGKYTCKECVEYPEFMDAKVKALMQEMIKLGSETGAYVLKEGQVVPGPDALYQLSELRVGRRRATVFQRAVCRCSGVGVPACCLSMFWRWCSSVLVVSVLAKVTPCLPDPQPNSNSP